MMPLALAPPFVRSRACPMAPQRVGNRGRERPVLVAERVGERLMVQPRRAHRVGQRHVVVDHVEDHLRSSP